MNEPEIYQIRVGGHLDDEWAEWFAGMTIVREEDGTSLLTGPVKDQSALQGLLLKIHDLALPLLSLQRIEPGVNDSILDED
jgi:hypothetical protein